MINEFSGGDETAQLQRDYSLLESKIVEFEHKVGVQLSLKAKADQLASLGKRKQRQEAESIILDANKTIIDLALSLTRFLPRFRDVNAKLRSSSRGSINSQRTSSINIPDDTQFRTTSQMYKPTKRSSQISGSQQTIPNRDDSILAMMNSNQTPILPPKDGNDAKFSNSPATINSTNEVAELSRLLREAEQHLKKTTSDYQVLLSAFHNQEIILKKQAVNIDGQNQYLHRQQGFIKDLENRLRSSQLPPTTTANNQSPQQEDQKITTLTKELDNLKNAHQKLFAQHNADLNELTELRGREEDLEARVSYMKSETMDLNNRLTLTSTTQQNNDNSVLLNSAPKFEDDDTLKRFEKDNEKIQELLKLVQKYEYELDMNTKNVKTLESQMKIQVQDLNVQLQDLQFRYDQSSNDYESQIKAIKSRYELKLLTSGGKSRSPPPSGSQQTPDIAYQLEQELQKARMSLESHIATSADRIYGLENQISVFKGIVESQRSDNLSLTSKLEDVDALKDAHMVELMHQIKSAKTVEDKFEELLRIHEAQDSHFKTLIQSANLAEQKLETKIADLEMIIGRNEEKIDVLNQEKLDLSKELEKGLQNKNACDSNMVLFERQIDVSNTKIAELELTLNQATSQNDALLSSLNILQLELKDSSLNSTVQDEKLKSLEQKLQISENSIQMWKQKNEDLANLSITLKSDSGKEQELLANLRKSNEEFLAELDFLRSELESKKSLHSRAIAERESNLESTGLSLALALSDATRANEAIRALEVKMVESKRDAEEREAKRSEIDSKHNTAVKAFERQIAALNVQLEDSKNQTKSLMMDSSSSQNEIMKNFQAKSSELEETVRLLGLLKLENESLSLSLESKVKTNNEGLLLQISELQEELSNSVDLVNGLKGKDDKSSSSIAFLTTTNSDLLLQISSLKETIDKSNVEVSRKVDSENQINEMIKIKSNELEVFKKQILDLERQVEELNKTKTNQIEVITTEKMKLEHQYNVLKTSTSTELDEMKIQLSSKDSTIFQSENEIKSLKVILEKTNSQIALLGANSSSTEEQLLKSLDLKSNEVESLKASLNSIQSSHQIEMNENLVKLDTFILQNIDMKSQLTNKIELLETELAASRRQEVKSNDVVEKTPLEGGVCELVKENEVLQERMNEIIMKNMDFMQEKAELERQIFIMKKAMESQTNAQPQQGQKESSWW